ncbi:MAG TPA: hypothetical protein VK470_11250 [Bacteroidota bacterium]|nr:hypothetical protein [Bacteroidota bacterium]
MKAPAEPEMPSWNTRLSVPIVDRTFYFSELIAKDDKFQTLVDGEVVYRPDDLINTPTAVPLPTLTPVTASLSNKLGAVPLTIPTIPRVELGMTDLLGQAPPQVQWVFGDASVTENIWVTSDTASFDYVVFDNGRMLVTLQNTMNFAVTFPSGISVMNVYSPKDTNEVLATFYPDRLEAHSSAVVSAPLSNKKMSSRLKLKFAVQTVGMNGTVLDPLGKISASIAIDGGSTGTSATMQSAKVRIDGDYGVAKTEGSLQVLDDSIYISQAEFNKGGFDLRITNNVAVDVVAGLVLKEVVDKKTGKQFRLREGGTGAPQDSVIIPANSVFVQKVNLTDYSYISQNTVGGQIVPSNGVHYTLTIKALKGTNDKRVISVTDEIKADLVPHVVNGKVEEYGVSRFIGVPHPTAVNINESIETNFSDVSGNFTADSIKTENARIVLKIFTPTTYPADLNLKITAYRDGVKGLSMMVPSGNGGLNGSYRILPGDTARIVLDKSTITSGTTIDQFLNSFVSGGKVRLPNKIVLEGTAMIEPTDVYRTGGNGLVGTVSDHDSLFSSVEFLFPMRLAITNGAIRDTADFSNTTKKDQLDLLESGTVTFEVENSFPVEGDVDLMLIRNRTAVDTLLNLTKTPLRITAAQYNASGSNTPSKSYSTVTIGKGDASKFQFATCSVVKAKMQTGNNGQPVSFRATDKIRIKAYGTFDLNVDFNKDSNAK